MVLKNCRDGLIPFLPCLKCTSNVFIEEDDPTVTTATVL